MSDENTEGLGYFDIDMEVEPGFINLRSKGLLDLLKGTNNVRITAEQAEEAGLYLLRAAAMSFCLTVMDEEDEDPDSGG